jgi:hypothetical protein
MGEMELVRQKVYQLEQQQIQIKQKWVTIHRVIEQLFSVMRGTTFLTASNIGMMMRLPVYTENSKTAVCNLNLPMLVVLPTARDTHKALNHQ